MNQVHKLKCWPEHFRAVRSREKPFEVRKNAPALKPGDIVRHKRDDALVKEKVLEISKSGGRRRGERSIPMNVLDTGMDALLVVGVNGE